MRLTDQLASVRHTFDANRARSALTLLGIMIGAGSIVMLAGLLRGGEEALLRSSQRANEADLIQVRRDEPPAKQLGRTRRDLGEGDVDLLGDSRLLAGASVASENQKESRALWQGRKKRVRLVGAGPVALDLYHLVLAQGRFLRTDDLVERRRVCVIGDEIWRELLEERASVDGVELEIQGQMWTVVGVLKNKPLLGGGGDGTWMWNRKVLVPSTTFNAIYSPARDVSRVFVRAGGDNLLASRLRVVESVVKGTILRRHLGIENFKIEGEEGAGNQERLILSIIKMLLLGTGLLSLFVGGINIMNIMLVTVTERTREIGIRRAIGATPAQVMMQFLLEASFIAFTGGVIGVTGGVALTWLAAKGLGSAVGEWRFHVEPWSIGLGLTLSVLTGIAFGLFPAVRASRLDPVEALRYE